MIHCEHWGWETLMDPGVHVPPFHRHAYKLNIRLCASHFFEPLDPPLGMKPGKRAAWNFYAVGSWVRPGPLSFRVLDTTGMKCNLRHLFKHHGLVFLSVLVKCKGLKITDAHLNEKNNNICRCFFTRGKHWGMVALWLHCGHPWRGYTCIPQSPGIWVILHTSKPNFTSVLPGLFPYNVIQQGIANCVYVYVINECYWLMKRNN